jgi:hypothetical protein
MPWSNAWDETKPADSDLASSLGQQGRQHKLDERERLNAQHIFGQSQTNDGEHRNIVISVNGIAADQEAIKVSGFSLDGANFQSLIDLAGTWNTSGLPTAIKLNVTDSASNAASNLLDLQVGGVSKFKVDKSGNVIQAGLISTVLTVVTKTSNYAAVSTDDVILVTATATITLLTAFGRTRVIVVKNDGSGTVTVGTTGGQTIDGVSTQTLFPGDSLTFVSDQTNWFII